MPVILSELTECASLYIGLVRHSQYSMENVECGSGLSTLVSGVKSNIEKALKWSVKHKTYMSTNLNYSAAQIVALVKIFEAVNPCRISGNIGRALEFASKDMEVVGWLRNTFSFRTQDVYSMFENWRESDPFMVFCVFDMNRKYHILHMAAFENNTKMVRWLLDAAIDVDARDLDDRTALHVAAKEGHTGLVRMLLDKGASMFLMDMKGRSPFQLALDRKHLDCADMLKPMVFVQRRLLGKSMLDVAVEDGTPWKIEYLLQYSNTSAVGEALCFAAQNGYPKVLEVLLKDSVGSLEHRNEKGYTPLDLAVINNHPEVVERLLAAGAQIDIGVKSLEYAKYKRMDEVVKALKKSMVTDNE